jgi:hypothetical protein
MAQALFHHIGKTCRPKNDSARSRDGPRSRPQGAGKVSRNADRAPLDDPPGHLFRARAWRAAFFFGVFRLTVGE